MNVTLEIVKGPEAGRKFNFDKPDTFIVGRGGKNHSVHFKLAADDPYVSRQHFMLEIAPPRVFFRNLSQTNKSHINDVPTDEAELNNEDIIEAGYTQLMVHLEVIKTRIFHCVRCGLPESILAEDKDPQYCMNCAKAIQAEVNKAKKKKPISIACTCGQDLSSLANSDGRAEELSGVVQYHCQKCVKTMMGGENAGKRIDDYTVIKDLGKGGMGIVYLVHHQQTGRVMALKQMLDLNNDTLAKRFTRETRYMRDLAHPNIVRFIDNGATKDGPYIVMESIMNGNLDKLMDPFSGRMAYDIAVPNLIGALQGLEYIHANKTVHRDLKPDNILLQEDGIGRLVPKISDFGIAKKYSEAGGSLATEAGVAMGTVMFMSPEQIRDTSSVREPADVYSMGVILYFLMTGKYPYNFPTPREIAKFQKENASRALTLMAAFQLIKQIENMKHPFIIILTQDQIPIQERNADIPTKLAKVVHKAIAKEIPERYQSAAEFRQALESIR